MITPGMGGRIKQARVDAGLKIKPFVAALDKSCTYTTVRRWESVQTDQSAPSLFYALRICEVCGVSIDWLLYGEAKDSCTAARFPTAGVSGESIAERIQERRKQVGLTREMLAKMMLTSQTKVRQWEEGRHLPSLYYLDKLCDALQISADELTMGGKCE